MRKQHSHRKSTCFFLEKRRSRQCTVYSTTTDCKQKDTRSGDKPLATSRWRQARRQINLRVSNFCFQHNCSAAITLLIEAWCVPCFSSSFCNMFFFFFFFRGIILELASKLNITAEEKRLSLAELHCADEVFTTGTMGEVRFTFFMLLLPLSLL